MKVKITAVQERPTLALKQGQAMTMELDGDALVALYHEQTMGLIEIEELPEDTKRQ